jgi:protein-tyrosine phosphatase
MPSLHWISGIDPHRVALMPCPQGGESLRAEVAALRRAGIGLMVSLLEAPEIGELGLDAEPELCAAEGIEFLSLPIPDHGTPAADHELSRLLDAMHDALLKGTGVAIHCYAGIGRTGVVSGCLLHRLGIPGEDLFHLLSRSRGWAMPETAEQAAWVERYIRAAVRSAAPPDPR